MKAESELEKLRKKIKEIEKTKQSLTKDVDAEIAALSKELLLKEQEEIEEKRKNRISLEEKFKTFLNETQGKIEEHLRLAEEQLNKAVEISDETGVPFETDLIMNFKRNSYIPQLKKIKAQFSDEIIDNFMYDNEFYNRSGWASDGWRSSSLSC